jgi:hypothetical protein
MYPRSLRWRIQLWHSLLLAATVAVVLVVFYGYERRARVARIDATLNGPLVALLPQLLPMRGQTVPELPGKLVRELEAAGHYVVAYRTTTEQTVYRSPTAPPLPELPVDLGRGVIFGRWNEANRELINITPRGDYVLLGRDR